MYVAVSAEQSHTCLSNTSVSKSASADPFPTQLGHSCKRACRDREHSSQAQVFKPERDMPWLQTLSTTTLSATSKGKKQTRRLPFAETCDADQTQRSGTVAGTVGRRLGVIILPLRQSQPALRFTRHRPRCTCLPRLRLSPRETAAAPGSFRSTLSDTAANLTACVAHRAAL